MSKKKPPSINKEDIEALLKEVELQKDFNPEEHDSKAKLEITKKFG